MTMVWAVSVMVVLGNAALAVWMGRYATWAAIGPAVGAAAVTVTTAVAWLHRPRGAPVRERRLGVTRLDTDGTRELFHLIARAGAPKQRLTALAGSKRALLYVRIVDGTYEDPAPLPRPRPRTRKGVIL